MFRELTGASVGATTVEVRVLVIAVTGGVLTKRQEQALVRRTALSRVPTSEQCLAKAGYVGVSTARLSSAVVTVVVYAVDLLCRVSTGSYMGMFGYPQICRDSCLGRGDGLGSRSHRLSGGDQRRFNERSDASAEVCTTILGYLGRRSIK